MQLTYSHTSAHTRYSCYAKANRIAFLHIHSTFTSLSASKFISAFNFFFLLFECFLVSPFLLVFFVSLLFLFTSPSFGPLPAFFELAVSSLDRSSPLPEGRSRSLRSNRSFGGSSVTVVKMTPLSFLPGLRIIKYLGIINMFFIRETTSLREVRFHEHTTYINLWIIFKVCAYLYT